ncbi:MAG TPA: pyridoxal phosphate-dependent aminotransferase, partial [bacterium]|nr:pyridoxal phosphate-dependent aminotransferase [bacterium]
MFASRTGWKLTPNPLTVLKDKLEASGVPLLDLTESNPTRCEFSYLHGTLLRAFADPRNFTYRPLPAGLPEARHAIASYYRDKGIT